MLLGRNLNLSIILALILYASGGMTAVNREDEIAAWNVKPHKTDATILSEFTLRLRKDCMDALVASSERWGKVMSDDGTADDGTDKRSVMQIWTGSARDFCDYYKFVQEMQELLERNSSGVSSK